MKNKLWIGRVGHAHQSRNNTKTASRRQAEVATTRDARARWQRGVDAALAGSRAGSRRRTRHARVGSHAAVPRQIRRRVSRRALIRCTSWNSSFWRSASTAAIEEVADLAGAGDVVENRGAAVLDDGGGGAAFEVGFGEGERGQRGGGEEDRAEGWHLWWLQSVERVTKGETTMQQRFRR